MHSAKVLPCEVCDFTTDNTELLETHLLDHDINMSIKLYKCNQCEFSESEKSKLQSHLKYIHGSPTSSEISLDDMNEGLENLEKVSWEEQRLDDQQMKHPELRISIKQKIMKKQMGTILNKKRLKIEPNTEMNKFVKSR